MKTVTALLALTFTTLSWGFDHNVVKGQWAMYESNILSKDYYYFLYISKDYSGTFVRSLNHDPIIHKFSSNDVAKRDGYIEIRLNSREKAVLSAWKSKSGGGRLTGQIFMYKESGELFNMLYFPLQYLKDGHEFLKHEEIKRFSNTYR